MAHVRWPELRLNIWVFLTGVGLGALICAYVRGTLWVFLLNFGSGVASSIIASYVYGMVKRPRNRKWSEQSTTGGFVTFACQVPQHPAAQAAMSTLHLHANTAPGTATTWGEDTTSVPNVVGGDAQ